MRRRRTVTLWGALLCLAILPATASAGNWESSAGLTYDGEPGEANHVTVQFDGASVTVTDTAGVRPYGAYWCAQNPQGVGCPYDPSGGIAGDPERCTQLSANSFRCPYTGNLGFYYLQDGNDSLTYSGPAPALPKESSNYGEQLNVFGGEGDDTITGSPYVDSLEGDFNSGSGTGAGSDRINGGGGNDQIGTGRYDTAANSNTADGGAGNDRISTDNGTNVVHLGSGKDFFQGGDGRDTAFGEAGRDDLAGGAGRDMLSGGADKDVLDGGPGNDTVKGDSGNDSLSASFHGGCGGPDTFVGGPGKDSLYVYCGRPTILFRDRTRDTGTCSRSVRPVRLALDRIDKLGGRC
jgi:hemolysin type calcium-binding protein